VGVSIRAHTNTARTWDDLPHDPDRLVPGVDELLLVRLERLAGDLVRPAGVVSASNALAELQDGGYG
jgi:hypothetical protein